MLFITPCPGDLAALMINNIPLDRRATLTLLRLSSFTGLVSSSLLPTRYSLAHPFELQVGWSRWKHFRASHECEERYVTILWLNGNSRDTLLHSLAAFARYTEIDMTLESTMKTT